MIGDTPFVRPRRIPRRLAFDESTPFPGLVIRCHGMSVDEWLHWTVNDAIAAFRERVLEWNWADPDTGPVPATSEAIGRLDAADIHTLTLEWHRLVSGVHPRPFDTPEDLVPAEMIPAPYDETGIPMDPPGTMS